MSLLNDNDEHVFVINLCQLLATSVSCILLLFSGFYQVYQFWRNSARHSNSNISSEPAESNDSYSNKNEDSTNRRRKSSTLFSFHNLRSSFELILLAINSLELCRSQLPFTTQELMHLAENRELLTLNSNENEHQFGKLVIYCSPFTVGNSIFGLFLTLIVIGFHRILEITNVPEYLYLSTIVEIILGGIRLCKLNSEQSFIELESCLNCSIGIIWSCLAIIDAFTIYRESFKPKQKVESSNDKKIGYKHTKSTFFSKIIFWWLNPLLWRGYQEPLEQEDLGYLREEDSAKAYYDHFLLIYKTACTQKKNPSLWLCYLKSSWKWFTLGGILKLFGDLSALIGPLSIHQIVEYIEKQYNHSTSDVTNQLPIIKSNVTNLYQLLFQHSILNKQNSLNLKELDSSILTVVDGHKEISIMDNQDIQNNYNNIYIFYYYSNWIELISNGWIIAWIVLMASIAQGGLSQSSTHLLNMTGIRIKTSLQGLIYRKTLLLSSSCLDKTSTINYGDGDGDSDLGGVKREGTEYIRKISNVNGGASGRRDAGSITNLMSEDALNIMSFFWIAHYVWAIPLKIGIVMYLLYLKLGISAIIGSVVCIFTMTPLQFLIGKAMSKNSEMSAQCTDERLKRTNDIFLGIKIIKLNAWEKVFKDKIAIARQNELKYLNKDSFYWTVMTFLTHVSSVLITFVTLAFYVKLQNDNTMTTNLIDNPEFTASRLFSALALFNQLTVPLLIFPITVPIIISAIVSTKRLERFLSEPEVQREFEGIRNMARILSKSDASLDMYENDKKISFNPHYNDENNGGGVGGGTVSQGTTSSTSNFINNKIQENEITENEIKNKNEVFLTSTNPVEAVTTKILPSDNKIISYNGEHFEINELTSNRDNTNNYNNNNNNNINNNFTNKKQNNRKGTNKSNICGNVKVRVETTPIIIQSIETIDDCKNYPKTKLRREYNSHTLPKNKNFCNYQDLLRFGSPPSQIPSSATATAAAAAATTATATSVTSSATPTIRKLITGRDSLKFQTVNSIAVSIKNSVFAWDNCSTLLKIDQIDIPKGKLTIIVGKSGSGKSSMLAALLKEMQQISGDIVWNKYSTTAYVPQIPWLLNSSIRENILFGESFRPKRYEKVLEACALKPDIELMPEGDMTVIGERGINLSGGQKQRIVIARSLYSSANVVIMDDPLSSLDNEVAKHVFENSIKKMLLKANRTVILVTQRLQLVYNADYIIVMKDNCVQSAGSYSEIERNNQEVIIEWNLIMEKGNDKDQISPGKTARERWRLFKNISKIGLLQRPQEMEQENMLSTQSLYMQSKRRSSIFGSRHLIYDIPLPIDECQNDDIIIKRRNSTSRRSLLMMMGLLGSGGTLSGNCTSEIRNQTGDCNTTVNRKNNILRMNSLQPEMRCDNRTPVVRNISSPGRFHDPKNRIVENEFKPKTGFRQFLYRMSSRRSNVGSRLHRTISASNSIQSISEECQPTLTRAESTSSECLDDESVQDLQDNIDNINKFYDEERKYGEIPLQIYMLYLKSCGLPIVLIFFLTALIWQCLRVYTDVWLRNWTEMVSYDNKELYDVTYCFYIYTIISSVCIAMSLISTPAGQKAGCNAREILHKQLVNSILAKPLHFFQTTPLGKILNRFSNDMAIIDKKIAPTSQRLLQFTLLCLFAVLINLAITPWFIVFTIPICVAYYIIQKFYRCSSRELQRLENITHSPVISHFNETIQGVTTIRAYSQESRFTETLFKKLEANTMAFVILNTSNRWLGIALDYLGGVIVFLAIITALVASSIASNKQLNDADGSVINSKNFSSVLHQEYDENKYNHHHHHQHDHHYYFEPSPSPSLVGLAINYTLLIPIYLNWVVKLLADMEMYVGSVERVAYYQQNTNNYNRKINNNNINREDDNDNTDIDDDNNENQYKEETISCRKGGNNRIPGPVGKDLIDCRKGVIETDEISSASANEYLGMYKKVPISWPQKGDIIFEEVSLRYQGQKQNVITDLSLRIPAGQRIGICGRTGSGKSSLALSLFSVLDVINGKIFIDDVDITCIHPDETRSRLSIIPQDVHLFNATIRDNLDPRGYYSDLELWNCLELAQLKDIVSGMPLGLDTEIIEGGWNLSAGHRQLFCLARAVLRGSVCLVLDEATSSLDTITEQSLMDAAHNAFKGRTILTIAHRLSTLLNYDRIIVLENGQIVEDGQPNDLQNLPDGKFMKMLNSGNS